MTTEMLDAIRAMGREPVIVQLRTMPIQSRLRDLVVTDDGIVGTQVGDGQKLFVPWENVGFVVTAPDGIMNAVPQLAIARPKGDSWPRS